jgi:hypothetical protein
MIFKELLEDSAKQRYEIFRQDTVKACDSFNATLELWATGNNKERIVKELLPTAFIRAKAILYLLTENYANEAVILWRSLYEIECIISLIEKSDKVVADTYYECKRTKNPKEFAKKIGIESSNTNRLVKENIQNYGWLAKVKGYKKDIRIAFNGVQKLANLGKNVEYNKACSVTHASENEKEFEELFEFVIENVCKSMLGLILIYQRYHDITDDSLINYITLIKSWVE